MKASKSQLARIHIAKKDLGLDEQVYRQVLINETGKRSAAEMTYGQARTVLEYFQKCGWHPKNAERRTPNAELEAAGRPGFASPRQIGMIKGIWADLFYAPKDRQAGALRDFMHRIAGVSDLRFLSDIGAQKVIVALQAMQQQARGKRAARAARLRRAFEEAPIREPICRAFEEASRGSQGEARGQDADVSI